MKLRQLINLLINSTSDLDSEVKMKVGEQPMAHVGVVIDNQTDPNDEEAGPILCIFSE